MMTTLLLVLGVIDSVVAGLSDVVSADVAAVIDTTSVVVVMVAVVSGRSVVVVAGSVSVVFGLSVVGSGLGVTEGSSVGDDIVVVVYPPELRGSGVVRGGTCRVEVPGSGSDGAVDFGGE